MSAPVESKVYGATIGTGAGATVASFILWLLGVTVWHVPDTAARASDAVVAAPWPVAALVGLGITVGGSFLGGWLAKHTPRAADAQAPMESAAPDAPAPVEPAAAPVYAPIPAGAGSPEPGNL